MVGSIDGCEDHCSVLGGEANGVRDVETLNKHEAERGRCHWRVAAGRGASGGARALLVLGLKFLAPFGHALLAGGAGPSHLGSRVPRFLALVRVEPCGLQAEMMTWIRWCWLPSAAMTPVPGDAANPLYQPVVAVMSDGEARRRGSRIAMQRQTCWNFISWKMPPHAPTQLDSYLSFRLGSSAPSRPL